MHSTRTLYAAFRQCLLQLRCHHSGCVRSWLVLDAVVVIRFRGVLKAAAGKIPLQACWLKVVGRVTDDTEYPESRYSPDGPYAQSWRTCMR
jgi:hypothetical protein